MRTFAIVKDLINLFTKNNTFSGPLTHGSNHQHSQYSYSTDKHLTATTNTWLMFLLHGGERVCDLAALSSLLWMCRLVVLLTLKPAWVVTQVTSATSTLVYLLIEQNAIVSLLLGRISPHLCNIVQCIYIQNLDWINVNFWINIAYGDIHSHTKWINYEVIDKSCYLRYPLQFYIKGHWRVASVREAIDSLALALFVWCLLW